MKNKAPSFSHNILATLIRRGFVVDGRSGGLILGNSHANSGITAFCMEPSNCIAFPNFEGGEYLINLHASNAFRDRLIEINQPTEHAKLPSLKISASTQVINSWAKPDCKLIWIERGQFIVNRNSTAKNIDELEQINHQVPQFSISEWFHK